MHKLHFKNYLDVKQPYYIINEIFYTKMGSESSFDAVWGVFDVNDLTYCILVCKYTLLKVNDNHWIAFMQCEANMPEVYQ